MARNSLDRSLAFTALLELNPEGFGKSSDPEGAQTITTFLGDFYQSGATNMYTYCREWLDARDGQVLEIVRQAEEAQAAEPPAPGPLSTPEAEAAYEAEYGERYGAHDNAPEPEPEATPYELWLSDDPEATWDDPSLAGPADHAAEVEKDLEAVQRVAAGQAEQLREAAERYQLNGEIPSGQTAEGDPVYQEADPEDPDKPWQVTAQVQRTVMDARGQWQSSRQVPAFTIPRALAWTKGDAEAKAREIINPYGEPYDINMDVTTDYVTPERHSEPQPDRQVLVGDEQQLGAVQEGQAEACAEARGPRGPSASYAERVAEAQEDPGPGERQLEDWNEHDYQVDGLEAERGE